jgi:hypothetical protein
MDDKLYTITLSLIGFGFGGLVFWRIFKALLLLYKNRCGNECDKESYPCYCRVLEAGMDKELYRAMLERRNELWQQFGQISIAALVAITLAVLLLTKTIDAIAGLPLLSAVGGFSLAKTAGTKENRTILPGEKKAGHE